MIINALRNKKLSESKIKEAETAALSGLKQLVIDGITNTLPDFDDSDDQYTVKELTDSFANGALDIPDQKFRVPFIRNNDPLSTRYMIAIVKDGAFILTLNFQTGGEWKTNTNLINSELPKPMFSINEHIFKVI